MTVGERGVDRPGQGILWVEGGRGRSGAMPGDAHPSHRTAGVGICSLQILGWQIGRGWPGIHPDRIHKRGSVHGFLHLGIVQEKAGGGQAKGGVAIIKPAIYGIASLVEVDFGSADGVAETKHPGPVDSAAKAVLVGPSAFRRWHLGGGRADSHSFDRCVIGFQSGHPQIAIKSIISNCPPGIEEVHRSAKLDLFRIADAFDRGRLAFGLAECRQKHARQNGDDRDYHEQLDQRERDPAGCRHNSWGWASHGGMHRRSRCGDSASPHSTETQGRLNR